MFNATKINKMEIKISPIKSINILLRQKNKVTNYDIKIYIYIQTVLI